jgi:DNA-binding CsgD family transcriptional regulator
MADLDRQRLRDAMGAETFEAEYAAGRSLDMARVADEVLQGMRAERTGALVNEPGDGSGESASVLTPRELDVLRLVAPGLSNADIAQRLVLGQQTVHRHLANMLRKLNISSRSAAAAWGGAQRARLSPAQAGHLPWLCRANCELYLLSPLCGWLLDKVSRICPAVRGQGGWQCPSPVSMTTPSR